MMCLTPLSLFSMKIFLVIRPLIKSLITFKTIFCVAKACLFKSCNIYGKMIWYCKEMNFQHQQPPSTNTQKTKKEGAKAKNLNMTERILIFDLTDINQIIHVCTISF